MKRLRTSKLTRLAALFLLITTTGIKAQVTIGINEEPVTGSLLQLKEYPSAGGANSNRGLGLPRVKLTDAANLFPMFAETDGVTPTAEYISDKSTIDPAHIGLTVFHTDNCSMYGKGVYVWEANGWSKLGKQESPGVRLNPNIPMILLPSGKDLRGHTVTNLEVIVGPGNNTATVTASTSSPYLPAITPLNMIAFTGSNVLPSTLSSGTTTMALLPDVMSEVTYNSPWVSKETKLTFNTECGTAEILLNQTNYAMMVGSAANRTAKDSLITFHGINQTHGLNVWCNAIWSVVVTDNDIILDNYYTTPVDGMINGQEKIDGTTAGGTGLRVTAKPGGKGKRFFRANALFADTHIPKRFNDINVEMRQCQGTEDLTAIEALPYETEYGPNKVKRHFDTRGPQGNYDYYSADFGDAGRWMITNMSAITYDTNRTDGLANPSSVNIHNSYNATQNINMACWGYPTKSGETDPTLNDLWVNNPHFGLLYTWTMATGGRSTSAKEFGQKYTVDGGTQVKVQGICPAGWHLPSDWEWTQLEKEIIKNTTKYADVTENLEDMTGGYVFNETQQYGSRGELHGNMMKDNCEPIAANSDLSNYGQSKKVINGGFSGLLAGYANTDVHIGKSANFGHIGSYMTASSNDTNYDIRRSISTGKSANIAANINKYQMGSVRCVQDWF